MPFSVLSLFLAVPALFASTACVSPADETTPAPAAATAEPAPTSAPEPAIASEPSVTPEPSLAPEPAIASEPSVTPEPSLAPEPAIASASTPAPAPTPTPAATAAPAATAVRSTSNAPSIFGEPLFVNGRRVEDADIQRYLIYGPCRLQLELFRLGLMIEDELDRRARDEATASLEPEIGPWARETAERRVAEQEQREPFATPEAREAALAKEIESARAERLRDPELSAKWEKLRASQRTLLAEQLVPTDEEFEAEFQKSLDDFKKNYPVLDVEAEVSRAFRTVEWYRDNLRQMLYFDRVFYPENPDEWPVTTIEAVRADSQEVLLNDAHESYKMRKEYAEKSGEPLPKEDGMYTQMMRQIVRDAMFATIDWRTAFDGLPNDLVLTADRNFDGKPELVVRTADQWERVKDSVSQTEIDEAKRWFVTYWATYDRLEKESRLLDATQRADELVAVNAQFEGTYFNIEALATQTYFFPSTETYLDFHMLLAGFRRALEPELKTQEDGSLPPRLAEYLPYANRVMGLGQVDCEVMLFSAFDIEHFRWKPDGWNWAQKRANEVKAKIAQQQAAWDADRAARAAAQAEGREHVSPPDLVEPYRYWSQLMDEHSEYWDPPAPEQGRASDVGMKNRGRFKERYRNDLQGFVGETPYSVWVTSWSITDHVFETQEVDTVDGPLHHPMGWVLTRVLRRTPPSRPLNLADPKHVDLLRDDYVRNKAFVDYARESRLAADVKGFEFGF